ncbi:indole-3-glycerol phosphate synthase [Halodesulfurarchaeum formicicum]|uniref:Indole-3-glycerol phosphate synthase n=1 Tax=Halodesulfurarchaeum formicicum TaxID=1873524 RepID=A0A1D8S5I3_9EURY|nr:MULTISPECIES: indole-3-glycerol-phosphate synthase [Halodesulfurarchaeum]AOW80618.1 indole-3-glycerol phosphate synthase [Halodesulfurarchaeum formicicum]MDR5656782.1 indole-3-glycerol-phosphate synthase [Halodesulfurarchaeum sp. HSR-GB]
MGTTKQPGRELAPAVRELLAAASERSRGDERVSVEARSLPGAFERARTEGRTPLIAEVKPTSPTASYENHVDPVAAAESMVAGGASAISVLTEPDHFGGSIEALQAVREAVSVPVLRKDFLLREAQLDAVAADAVLLIARFLDDLDGMIEAARDRGMTPLVETHTRDEIETALAAGAEVIGVNNRDLASLTVDRSTVERLAPAVPDSATLIAESGIQTTEHRDTMLGAGADGLLVGSAIMDGDIEANTRRLVAR